MSLLCWNCRRIGKAATVRELHTLARQFAPSILCILETQLEGSRVEQLAEGLGFNKSFAVSSSGRSGGLCIFWNDEIKVQILGYSRYHIDALVDNMVDIQVRISFVYGEAQVPNRQNTWNTLKNIAETQNRPWAVIGDFNEVLNLSKHDGVGSRSQAQIDGFREAVDTCGLSDIGYTGTDWTFEKRLLGVPTLEYGSTDAWLTRNGC